MISFLVIFGVGLLGIIILLSVAVKTSQPRHWYVVNWDHIHRQVFRSIERIIKKITITALVFLVTLYRKSLHLSTASAKKAVRKILFPSGHAARDASARSDFLNDILEHKKEMEEEKQTLEKKNNEW